MKNGSIFGCSGYVSPEFQFLAKPYQIADIIKILRATT